ncbi:hypothetical protein NCC49_000535 [Naganishia albida]|nr:hypothetical protein NCC49_000535 [Naganishia albida]
MEYKPKNLRNRLFMAPTERGRGRAQPRSKAVLHADQRSSESDDADPADPAYESDSLSKASSGLTSSPDGSEVAESIGGATFSPPLETVYDPIGYPPPIPSVKLSRETKMLSLNRILGLNVPESVPLGQLDGLKKDTYKVLQEIVRKYVEDLNDPRTWTEISNSEELSP